MQKETENWFTSWFDTPYYHILYQDRDFEEAQTFMKKITKRLALKKGQSILDLACGKGRHAINLNNLGYDVTGVDLSPASILYAKDFENKTLHFDVHDMCKPYPKKFDAVFNLFTSFGYFEKEEDNYRTITAIKANLKEGGKAVLDFMNVDYTIKTLIEKETKTVNKITFHLHRYVKDGYIFKDISFIDNKENYLFTEKVKALTKEDFMAYFKKAGIELIDTFGNYKLDPFILESSPRLILIFK
ncbi:MAG: SAM-dependent methyltransferase [Flavobacteriaceae bacterium CG_4_8_14_3_um_filter_34_10]|nr:methyltransferase domain-containing protein [Flavobacteriia bacterium]OIP49081.1 MAG: SAM-dependent methyltransferase [Flavobacteriaceae bacterium CG2_30_34_30]PIQ17641.1 MAG: SAM-dependent methyltransferase [Flavobacteriaceae bacterium CG18_big_fil_WC_8_21_14_2_50_34_36]PIV51358.1 MAG: SAM-dependent methyltransferase [Flavobacteriaceae bacterium CG02_land_8_20_14_3_00_34_13]PIX10722.1 MAG: SAM-dependent methyltransferase [Flavobacteriaceae bacterium CG_4_8_14_3_um_filter_34_10]PIZ07200.1 M